MRTFTANGKDAFKAWASARKDAGKEIPEPFYHPDTVHEVSGKFVTNLKLPMKQRLAAVDSALNVIRAQLGEEGINCRSRPSSSTTTARK